MQGGDRWSVRNAKPVADGLEMFARHTSLTCVASEAHVQNSQVPCCRLGRSPVEGLLTAEWMLGLGDPLDFQTQTHHQASDAVEM